MLQKELGKLLRELRKEHLTKPGKHWTQLDMADKLSEELMQQGAPSKGYSRPNIKDFKIISSIERGVRGLSPCELLAYAEALQLTSGERLELFLGACGINSSDLVRKEKDAEEVRDRLLQRRVELPAFIIDQYCDVVAANAAVFPLLGIKGDLGIGSMQEKYSQFAYNMLQYVFSPEAVRYFQNRMNRTDWERWAYQNMMMFRSSTLRYRTTPYYNQLFDCLWQHPAFRRHWNNAYDIEKDYFIDTEEIVMSTLDGYRLSFFSSDTTAVTTAGELRYCVYVPKTAETRDFFSQLIEQTDTEMVPMAPWPKKN